MAITQEIRAASTKVAQECVNFLNSSPSPFHAVETCKTELLGKGFTQLMENDSWKGKVKAAGKYFVTRNQSSLIAFTVGGGYKKGNGLKILGAHTDSPCFVLKPKTAEKSSGYKQVGVQTYGGGLWHTWFDRDVSIAGRVVFTNDAGDLQTKLVKIDKPIMRIPNLAIHLTTADERTKGFNFNKETHLLPMLCSEAISNLVNGNETSDKPKHHSDLLAAIAAEAGCPAEKLTDFEIYLYDTHKGCLGGLYDEFIFSARIDNQISCYSVIKALTSLTDNEVKADDMVSMIAVFDHEEVGSASAVGAAGSFTTDVVRRLVSVFDGADPDSYEQSIRSSFVISVDGVHGVHPNYTDRHQMNHRPTMHAGPAIKYNSNQRYATNSIGSSIVKALASLASTPVQEICVKNDSPCGSTIGPITATLTGITTIDIGNPMLSMHSVREQCGTLDILYMNNLLESFFRNYSKVRNSLPLD
eukprot:TRINITY_DN242_c4_g1_i1.p1 TRINITY_DN242_c4_g1~~TRINITY_DN242_c4_g1_i1.p1  ORF type:complete len:471 (+),score=66.99 TRINITY_DN242_c4_g1_i1:53-1465(+)